MIKWQINNGTKWKQPTLSQLYTLYTNTYIKEIFGVLSWINWSTNPLCICLSWKKMHIYKYLEIHWTQWKKMFVHYFLFPFLLLSRTDKLSSAGGERVQVSFWTHSFTMKVWNVHELKWQKGEITIRMYFHCLFFFFFLLSSIHIKMSLLSYRRFSQTVSLLSTRFVKNTLTTNKRCFDSQFLFLFLHCYLISHTSLPSRPSLRWLVLW